MATMYPNRQPVAEASVDDLACNAVVHRSYSLVAEIMAHLELRASYSSVTATVRPRPLP